MYKIIHKNYDWAGLSYLPPSDETALYNLFKSDKVRKICVRATTSEITESDRDGTIFRFRSKPSLGFLFSKFTDLLFRMDVFRVALR